MNSYENDMNKQNEEHAQRTDVFPKGFFLILTFLGISSCLVGFIIIISIIISFMNYQVLTNPHGLIVGVLLLGGGMILLISLVFLYHSSSVSSPSNSLIIHQNEQNS
ncbi:MAG: hypothetical protein ACFFDT_39350 [Candidatus Hodarchaeota archaeon]